MYLGNNVLHLYFNCVQLNCYQLISNVDYDINITSFAYHMFASVGKCQFDVLEMSLISPVRLRNEQ